VLAKSSLGRLVDGAAQMQIPAADGEQVATECLRDGCFGCLPSELVVAQRLRAHAEGCSANSPEFCHLDPRTFAEKVLERRLAVDGGDWLQPLYRQVARTHRGTMRGQPGAQPAVLQGRPPPPQPLRAPPPPRPALPQNPGVNAAGDHHLAGMGSRGPPIFCGGGGGGAGAAPDSMEEGMSSTAGAGAGPPCQPPQPLRPPPPPPPASAMPSGSQSAEVRQEANAAENGSKAQRASDGEAAASDSWSGLALSGLPTGRGVCLLEESLLAVRIPRFQSHGNFGSHVAFTILVEQPGATHSVSKRYSDFVKLNEEFRQKSFASSLPPLPPYRAFANFDQTFLEKRRQQLEAYVSFLCLHSLVLLDTVFWSWLAIDATLQVVVRLTVMHAMGLDAEMASCVLALEAALSSEGAIATCCLHPAVLRALRAVLDSQRTPAQALSSACRILERLMTQRRARQLFLPRVVGGVAALLAVHCRGGVAADAVQRVFEALCDADCETVNGGAAGHQASRKSAGSESGEAELGECSTYSSFPVSNGDQGGNGPCC